MILKLTKINLKSLALLLTLIIAFACSSEEDISVEETSIEEIQPEKVEIIPVESRLPPGENSNSSLTAMGIPTSSPVCTGSGTNSSRIYFVNGEDFNDTGVSKSRELDDRTCKYNYQQRNTGGRKYGVYRIAANSNHIDQIRDDGSQLQPRIERASRTISETGDGSYVRISGYVTIRRAGHQSSSLPKSNVNNPSGTYIMQAKGTHTGATNDPAILLLLAKPNFSGSTQVSYDIYSERITVRGGSGSSGRELVKLTTIPANTRRFISMTNGFRANGQQYVDVRIGGTTYPFNVPGNIGLQAKIRWGAYRVKGGEADIWWDGLSQKSVSVPAATSNNNNDDNWNPALSITKDAVEMYSSSDWSSYYNPYKANDSNLNTRWASSAYGTQHYLVAKFSGNRTVKSVRIKFENAYSSNFTIWAKHNGIWYDLGNFYNNKLDVKITGLNAYASEYSVHSYASSGAHNHISIKEFELYSN
ncbi:discoidin domain-containing protein [Hyunsoonleella pacifica]|uniref:Discoidin domain-containing protein n=1 Tax=Hyunsoonleella pacifica TaxID=1080224 RepID=A0A4Q9FRS8_9FLAO|nr:discoidin domain-containing protein [Hyunsoonleella pacifica]TBN18744.1 discoidin domain-containing protein [Hyunsoonleella pacifica]GGD04353.1 hypothetical protein GCM10011368_02760 [Hyunsoonleella pacifica]